MSGWLTNGMSLATLPLTGNERFPLDTQLASGATPEMEAVSMSQAAMYLGGGGSVPWVAARFYGFPPATVPTPVVTLTGTLYAYPLYIPATTIKTVSVGSAQGQTGGNAHVGVYADNGAGYPGALVYDFGAVGALTATATVTLTASTPLALNSGLYWVASIFTATSTFPTVEGVSTLYTSPLTAQLGYDTAAHALATSAEAPSGISVAQTYGSLPSTFPAAATLTLNAPTPGAVFGV